MGIEPVPTRDPNNNSFVRFVNNVVAALDGPVDWFREKVVLSNRGPEYNWYHKQYRRVPTIDECYRDDYVCIFEADQQFSRDKKVDSGILWILRRRFEECVMYESPHHEETCRPLYNTYNDALTNWFIKYGDLGAYGTSKDAYFKQKHRLVWERRYGPVGTGKIPLADREAQIPKEQ